jgi:HK97 family phage portal protein
MNLLKLVARRAGAWLLRSSLENPSTSLSDPDDWAFDAFGASPATSGVRLSAETALELAPVWRGVNLISRDVAKLPLYVYRRLEERGRLRAIEHPAFQLLRHKPNADMTSFVFRQTLQAHALLEGNGLAWIERKPNGLPQELVPLTPGKAWPIRANGRLWYVVEVGGGEMRRLLPENVLHIKGLGFDGLSGYPMWAKAKNSFGLAMAAEQFGARYFRNNARPSVVIEHPGTMGDEALKRLLAQWNQLHQGLDNAHKTAILEEGAKLNPYGINARDSQLTELRQYQIREVASWLGVPPHKLGDTTKTSFASLEQENQSYLDDALDGWLVNWEEELRDKLLTEDEKRLDTHYVEFTREALVRADLKTRAEYYSKALGGQPWMVVDEVRGRENLNALPDGEGSIYRVPLNIGTPSENDQQEDDGDKDIDAARSVLADAAIRAIRRVAQHVRRAAKKGDFERWVRGMADEQRNALLEIVTPAARAAAAIVPGKASAGEAIDGMLQRLSQDLLTGGSDYAEECIAAHEESAAAALVRHILGDDDGTTDDRRTAGDD